MPYPPSFRCPFSFGLKSQIKGQLLLKPKESRCGLFCPIFCLFLILVPHMLSYNCFSICIPEHSNIFEGVT